MLEEPIFNVLILSRAESVKIKKNPLQQAHTKQAFYNAEINEQKPTRIFIFDNTVNFFSSMFFQISRGVA